MLVSAVHKKCSEPETVGNFHMGVHRALEAPQFCCVECTNGAQSLKLSAIFTMGMQAA